MNDYPTATDMIKVNRTDTTLTQHVVDVEFVAEDAGTDLLLGELRAALTAAAHLPDDATVSVHISRDGWVTPARLRMEHAVREEVGVAGTGKQAVEAEMEVSENPRTWATAAEVPDGVKVKPLGWVNGDLTFDRKGDRWTSYEPSGGIDRQGISTISMDCIWNAAGTGRGFIEVRS